MFNRLGGIKDEVYEEGTHFMVPWFERPIIYDVRASLLPGHSPLPCLPVSPGAAVAADCSAQAGPVASSCAPALPRSAALASPLAAVSPAAAAATRCCCTELPLVS